MQKNICPKCGQSEFDSGWILSAGKIAYKSDKLHYPIEGGNVRSHVCMNCGYLESFVETAYIEKILDK